MNTQDTGLADRTAESRGWMCMWCQSPEFTERFRYIRVLSFDNAVSTYHVPDTHTSAPTHNTHVSTCMCTRTHIHTERSEKTDIFL